MSTGEEPTEEVKQRPARPTDLLNQPAAGYRGHFIRPRGLLSADSPLRMRTGEPPLEAGVQPSTAGTLSILAVIALVLAFLAPIVGVVCGHIALVRLQRTGQTGRGLAIASLVVGYVFTVLWVAGIAALVALAAANGGNFSWHFSSNG